MGHEPHLISDLYTCPIYYEDTDLSGFVYHANYLKYFERAREHLIGVSFLAKLFESGMHFVVSRADLKFLAPIRHGDRLWVETKGEYSRSPAITFQQLAFRTDMDGFEQESLRSFSKSGPLTGTEMEGFKGRVLCCRGEVTIVILNQDHQPVRMPETVLTHFQSRH